MKDNYRISIFILFVGFLTGWWFGLVCVIVVFDDSEVSCINSVKESYDITDFDKIELESKIAACSLLYQGE